MSFDPNSNSLLTDPEFLLANPGYIKQAHDLLVQYGIIPTATGDASIDSAIADPTTQQEATANPYSVAAMLRKTYAGGLSNNDTNAVSHGAFASGAHENANLHSLDSYQQGLSTAGQNLESGFGTISGNRTNTLVDIWKRLATAPVTADTTVYGKAAAPPDESIGAGLPVPQQPYQRTGPEAGGALTPGSISSMFKLKPQGIGGMGHIT